MGQFGEGRTMDQFGDEASFEINREELSSVEQEETIDQMGIEASCESHADMSDPALYIHSMEKLDLATRKPLISQGAFQPKAHEMNISCHIHRKKMPFLSLLRFFCRGNEEQTFTKIGYRDWKKANEKFAKHESLSKISLSY